MTAEICAFHPDHTEADCVRSHAIRYTGRDGVKTVPLPDADIAQKHAAYTEHWQKANGIPVDVEILPNPAAA